MTTTTETEAPEQVTQQPTYFEAKPVPGLTTLNKGAAKFEVRPNDSHGDVTAGDVTVYDTGLGVQVTRPAASDEQPAPKPIDISDDFQTATAYNAAVRQPDGGPASIVTKGDVFLVNPEAEALEAAEDTKTEPETGIRLNFETYKATGQFGGREFDISLYEHAVTVYAGRIKVEPAAEPSTDETDTKLSLSKDFNRAVLEGSHVKVTIELDEKGQAVVHTTGGVRPAMAPDAKTGPALEVKGDVVHLTLAGGRMFDVNTATGDVTGYVPNKDVGIKNEGSPELDGAAPEYANDYQIVISQDGQRFALNNTSTGQSATIERSADGPLAVATEGVHQLKPVVESPSAVQAEKEKIGQPLENMKGWLYLDTLADGKIRLIASEDIGLMSRRRLEKLLKKLSDKNPTIALPDVDTLLRAFKNAARIGGFNTSGPLNTTQYQSESGEVLSFPSGVKSAGGTYEKYPARLVCTI